ncbi:MAG: glycoside hydrolase family 92 protein, partial [Bacteroidetes bacterium]|nr:glycoside hydrolase family 92 protein [Bacteroidota bacterium]
MIRNLPNKKKLAVLGTALLLGAGTLSAQHITSYVDPFIGTAAHGHVYPGATVPFGMVQLSPDNGRGGWDWCSGYNYSDSIITGFSHTHLSGTGIGDLADISVLPVTGIPAGTGKITSSFSHNQEKASPGYYSVVLKSFDIKAELTAGSRVGYHRYTFPASHDAMIRFDLGFAINWDAPVNTGFRKINDSTYAGYRFSTGWAKDQRVFFAVRLRKPLKQLRLYADGRPVDGDSASGKKTIACLVFDTRAAEQVLMKVGLSFADEAGAL